MATSNLELAQAVGMTVLLVLAVGRGPTPVHRHRFPTHQALLAAIAREGYLRLSQQVAESLSGQEAANLYNELSAAA